MIAAMQRAGRAVLTGARDAIFPLSCLTCDARVEAPGLCPVCWRETPFVAGAACETCGAALPGARAEPGLACDDCLAHPPPWDEGRAALTYAGRGRGLVLQLKHADRTELADAAALWLHRRARGLLAPTTLLVPVPLHRMRLLSRRYNQAALIARALAGLSGATFDPMVLTRVRRTPSQDRRSRAARFANVAGAIALRSEVAGRHVALVDDVMTSGATMTACAEALRAGGARRITVLTLARVAKDGTPNI